jgi:uncharacterized membrane protein YesL
LNTIEGKMSNLSKKGFLDLYYDSIPFIGINLLWFLLTLPLITAFPAMAGLYYATNQLAHGKSAGGSEFFEGFRNYFWVSWCWGLMNIFVIVVLAVNIWFYGQVKASWADLIRGTSLGLMVIWGSMQFYIFPFLIEQKDRRLKVAVRNTLVMSLRSPLRTFGLAIGVMALTLIAAQYFAPALAIFLVSLSAYYANRTVIRTIDDLL